MARIKIELPEKFSFSTLIPVRITDLNYGGHVGNDAFLSIIHEARMQFLKKAGYAELDIGGIGLIMRDAAIEFRDELFYGDTVVASVTVADFSKAGFTIYYKLEKTIMGANKLVGIASTGMIGYDYSKKKIAAFGEDVREKLLAISH